MKMDANILKYKINIFASQDISIRFISLMDYSSKKREAHSARVLKVFNEVTICISVGRFEEINQKKKRKEKR